jgi:hypothetical protein
MIGHGSWMFDQASAEAARISDFAVPDLAATVVLVVVVQEPANRQHR